MTGGRLVFGTAGLRAEVGPGPAHMNVDNVLRATRASLEVLGARRKVDPGDRPNVVIGYDARIHSRAFAEASASLALRMGFEVRLFDGPIATPVIAHAGAAAGSMATFVFTASHNPRDDHGMKVYDDGGWPIVEPLDAEIAAKMHDERPAPDDVPLEALDPAARAALHRAGDAEERAHGDDCRRLAIGYRVPGDRRLRVAYTALHGVAQRSFDRLLDDPRFRITRVAEQALPDGRFPTVPKPNPELPDAVRMLADTMRAAGAEVGLANDPDGDRLAVLLPDEQGNPRALHGDELGVLLGHAAITRGAGISGAFVLTTVVSSSWLGRIASDLGVEHERTLTGHKWLQARRAAREAAGGHMLFAYEEALGYAFPTGVHDKDGLCAALVFAEIARGLAEQGQTAWDALGAIARRHGLVRNGARTLAADAAAMARLESARRAPPAQVGERRVVAVVDGRARVRHALDGGSTALALPASSLLAFELEDGSRVSLRPSGTEPKLKVYLEVAGTLDAGATYLDGCRRLDVAATQVADATVGWFSGASGPA